MKTDTAAMVEQLAKKNEIKHSKNTLDDFAHVVTKLSGDDVENDETIDLIIALNRAGVISKIEVATLSVNHLRERTSLS